MIISEDVAKNILEDSIADLVSAELNIIKYASVIETSDKAIIMTLDDRSSVKSIYKKGDACVYAIYELSATNVIKYIGSSLDIIDRLKEHLVKNDSALSDGSFVENSSGIIKHSKLANVYHLMRSATKKEIGYKVISVCPKEYYTAVESELIKHYDLKNVGWNRKQ